jgi:hypothetical protein
VSQEQSRNSEHQGWNGKESQESILGGIESIGKRIIDKGSIKRGCKEIDRELQGSSQEEVQCNEKEKKRRQERKMKG